MFMEMHVLHPGDVVGLGSRAKKASKLVGGMTVIDVEGIGL
jgi:hypothetical protein